MNEKRDNGPKEILGQARYKARQGYTDRAKFAADPSKKGLLSI